MNQLLSRLHKGHRWLTDTHLGMLSLDDIGRHSPLEAKFMDALDLWDGIELQLRELYNYEGCITKEGQCPDSSPVACRHCGQLRKVEEAHPTQPLLIYGEL